MRLYSDGRVVWIQPQRLTTTCDVSIERFPYDSQACYIEFVFFGLNSVDVVANVTREVSQTITEETLDVIKKFMHARYAMAHHLRKRVVC